MKEIFTINKDNTLDWRFYRLEDDDYELQENETNIRPPDGLYIPKWDGKTGVESGSPPELEIIEESVSDEEILMAEFIIDTYSEIETLKNEIEQLKSIQ